MSKLIASQVKGAIPSKKPYKLSDGGGLYLLINKAGKYWRFDYRFVKKRKTLALGVYPEVSLKKARIKHSEAKSILADGNDPSFLRRMNKETIHYFAENSFEKLANDWFSKQNWTEGHARTVRSRMDNYILPWIGKMAIKDISAPDVLSICRRVESRGTIETAHRIKSICSQVLRYCVVVGLIESDPCRDLAGALIPSSPKHMSAITEPKKIGGLLRAIDSYEGHLITKSALSFAPLVFVRPGELRHAEWSEFDLDGCQWKIPAEKMKMKTTHIVPLSQQAMIVLEDIKPLTGHGRFVFPSLRSESRPMSENTVNAALRRLGYSKEEMTGHGFRSMASTNLHELGWESNVIETQLAHQERNSVKAAYNYAEYLNERRKMMQFWADYLDKLKLQI
jgi:integrase